MEAHTRDGVQQPLQWDHLNLDRSISSVIIVGSGGIVTNNVPARGHQLEDLKWGCSTSKPGKGSQQGEETVRNDGEGGTSGWGLEGSHYHNPDPLCRLIGPKNEVK